MEAGTKMIVLDAPTKRFLEELPKLRGKLGQTQRELAASINLPYSTYKNYERRVRSPTLGNLMKLAEYFGYDLSESVNYKYYHNEFHDLKAKLSHYGLSMVELSSMTKYVLQQVLRSVHKQERGSVSCYAAILEVLSSERESEIFRQRYCTAREEGEALGLSWVGKKFLTRSEVAACLGVSAQTVSLWVRQDKLPAARGARRNMRWLVSELLEYERAGKIRREANDEV
ncbi:MAG: helix-turn-helix domain-containing protein [Synergistaceae bacterium]|nr:helix-turn-helix domain-containing protein [Synergistaceae bacterium]